VTSKLVSSARFFFLRWARVAVLLLAGCTGITHGADSSTPEPNVDGGKGHTQVSPKDGGAEQTSTDAGRLPLGDATVEGEPRADAAQTPADASAPGPIGSAGCGKPGRPAEGTQTMEVNSKSRTFIVHIPASYDAKTPYPLLFGFHGASRTAADFDNDAGTFRFGPAFGDRAILAYPNALQKNGVTTWSRETDDDLDFFDAMLEKLEAEACVNPARIFVTGHSSGGYFANTLGCRRGEVLRAIAPVAGGVRDFKDCKGKLAVWMAHGTQDSQVNVSQGQAARAHWLDSNGCAKETPPAAVAPSPCVAYSDCMVGYPVHWCEHGEPTYGNPATYHGWPSFATAAIVAFVEGLP